MPKPELKLTGLDGNAYLILAKAKRVAEKNGLPWSRIEQEAKVGSYDDLLQVMMKYFEAV